MRLLIDNKGLSATIICAAKNDVRKYINGLLIEVTSPTHCTVVATDGHVMALAHTACVMDDEAPPSIGASIIVPRDVVEFALKKLPSKDSLVPVDFSLTSPSLGAIGFKPSDEAFPDWRRVLPRPDQVEKPEEPSQFDPQLLMRAAKALAAWDCSPLPKNINYPMRQQNDRPGVMHNGDSNMCVIVMPSRRRDDPWQGFAGSVKYVAPATALPTQAAIEATEASAA